MNILKCISLLVNTKIKDIHLSLSNLVVEKQL